MRHLLQNTVVRCALAASAVAMTASLAQAATAADCRGLIGFNSAVASPLLPYVGAWSVVDASGDYFKSRRAVDSCEVKAVTGPRAKTSTVVYQAGPMTQDECSMYNGLASIDSKLALGKLLDAYNTATALVARIDDLAATGKLIDPGYGAIRRAAADIQACTATL